MNASTNTQSSSSNAASSVNPSQSAMTAPLLTTVTKAVSLTSVGSLVKLDRNNCLLWQSAILSIIHGHQMDHLLQGPLACPPAFIDVGNKRHRNPTYDDWVASDKLFLGWLYTTLSSDVAPQLVNYDSTFELCNAAKQLTASHTRARINLYCNELQRTRKGSMKMEEYLTKMKTIANNLALAGNPISTNDLTSQILAGLDRDYNPIVCQLLEKDALSWVELQAALLMYEKRLEQLNEFSNLTFGPQANLVTTLRKKLDLARDKSLAKSVLFLAKMDSI